MAPETGGRNRVHCEKPRTGPVLVPSRPFAHATESPKPGAAREALDARTYPRRRNTNGYVTRKSERIRGKTQVLPRSAMHASTSAASGSPSTTLDSTTLPSPVTTSSSRTLPSSDGWLGSARS